MEGSLSPGKNNGADKHIDHETYPPQQKMLNSRKTGRQGRDDLVAEEKCQADQGADIQLEGEKQDVKTIRPSIVLST
jgi:hypothetical protein